MTDSKDNNKGNTETMAMEDATLVKHTKQTFVLRSNTTDEAYPLQGEMLVGREVECAIPLNSGHISRYHAKINVSSFGVYVEDLHSTNGTYVNGHKIRGRVRLGIGDEVAFDDLVFRLTSNQAGNEASTKLTSSRSAQPTKASPAPMNKPVPSEGSVPDALKNRIDELRNIPLDELDDLPIPGEPKSSDAKSQEKSETGKSEGGISDGKAESSKRASGSLKAVPNKPENSEQAKASSSASAPSANSAGSSAANSAKVTPIPRAKSAPVSPAEEFEEEDHTQILSASQLNALVDRHRGERELNVGSGPRFIVMTAPIRGKVYDLASNGDVQKWQIGRDERSEICLNDKTISVNHARLAYTDSKGFVLTATNAKNGIYLNGVLVTRAELHHGDKIQIGRTELLFKTDEPESEEIEKKASNSIHPAINLETVSSKMRGSGVITAAIVLVVLVVAFFATQ